MHPSVYVRLNSLTQFDSASFYNIQNSSNLYTLIFGLNHSWNKEGRLCYNVLDQGQLCGPQVKKQQGKASLCPAPGLTGDKIFASSKLFSIHLFKLNPCGVKFWQIHLLSRNFWHTSLIFSSFQVIFGQYLSSNVYGSLWKPRRPGIF